MTRDTLNEDASVHMDSTSLSCHQRWNCLL